MSTPYRVIPDDGLRCQCGAIGGSLLTGGAGLPAFYLCGKCGIVGHAGAGLVSGRVEVPEPLTVERARAWLEAERARIGARPWGTNSAADFARFAALTNKVTGRQLSDDDLDALASLLVDAAAGRVR